MDTPNPPPGLACASAVPPTAAQSTAAPAAATMLEKSHIFAELRAKQLREWSAEDVMGAVTIFKQHDGDGDGRLNQTECTALALELGFEAQVNDRLGADDTIEIIDAFRAFTGATREEAENIFIVLDTVSDVVENVGVVSLHPTPAKLEEQKQRMTVRRIKRMRKSILATIPLEVPELPAHFIPRCKTLSFPLILPSRAVAAKKDSISTVYLRHD